MVRFSKGITLCRARGPPVEQASATSRPSGTHHNLGNLLAPAVHMQHSLQDAYKLFLKVLALDL